MKTGIIINLQVEGLHCWPDADKLIPEVGFLSNMHRHIFFVTMKKYVNHDDRDVEIIMFKRSVLDYITKEYWSPSANCHNFENKSCEMLAKELAQRFECYYASVLEDNENGAEVII